MALGVITRNLRYKALALVSAFMLWGVAHGTADVERGFDIPVTFVGLPENLVIVDQNSDVVNVRMRGSRAGLRRMALESFEYGVDVSGARPGAANYEVDLTRLEFPRGIKDVSRSPSNLLVTFEPRASRVVRVKPDVTGEPAPGFELASVELEPAEVMIAGARSEVQRRAELVTETIDVSGLQADARRAVKVALSRPHVWLAEDRPLQATIKIVPAGERKKR